MFSSRHVVELDRDVWLIGYALKLLGHRMGYDDGRVGRLDGGGCGDSG